MVLPLAMGWRHLLFANWPVESATLAPHLPDALALDEFDGTGWLSVTPLVNVAVRPRGAPRFLGVRLPELNVRTYVTVDGQPGVYFFSLDAEGVLSVLGARIFHRLPYYYARMSVDASDDRIRFESSRLHPGDRPARYAATYRPTGEPFTPAMGSLSSFLVDRHRLFTQAPDGSLRHTDVKHPPWTLYPAEVSVAENTLFAANGLSPPAGEPTVFYSPGVDVVTSRSRKWER